MRDLERDEPSLEAEAEPELEPAWGETVLEAVPEPEPEVELAHAAEVELAPEPQPESQEVHEPSFEVASEPELEEAPEPELAEAPEPVLEQVEALFDAEPELEDAPEPELEEAPEPVLEQVEALFETESSNGRAALAEDVGEPLAVDGSVDSAELAAAGIVLEEAPQPEPAAACFAFAPTTRGYVLVPLEQIPSAGQTIDLADVGKRVVLRVGSSPIPMDDRVCAFVEEQVTPPPAALPEEQSPRRFAASLAARPRPTLSL